MRAPHCRFLRVHHGEQPTAIAMRHHPSLYGEGYGSHRHAPSPLPLRREVELEDPRAPGAACVFYERSDSGVVEGADRLLAILRIQPCGADARVHCGRGVVGAAPRLRRRGLERDP